MVLSSLLFAAMHFYSWLGSTLIFIFGMMSCALFHHTGKLAPSMICHSVVNLFAVLCLHEIAGG